MLQSVVGFGEYCGKAYKGCACLLQVEILCELSIITMRVFIFRMGFLDGLEHFLYDKPYSVSAHDFFCLVQAHISKFAYTWDQYKSSSSEPHRNQQNDTLSLFSGWGINRGEDIVSNI